MPLKMHPKDPSQPLQGPPEAVTAPVRASEAPSAPSPSQEANVAPQDDSEALDMAPADHARHHDIARKLIMQQSLAEIAADYAMSARQMRRIVKRPGFLKIYRQVHTEMMSDLDSLIKDEKVTPLLRARAQAIRMQTVLQEVVDVVRDRIHDGSARATEMKVAADVAFGIIDRAKSELSNVQTKGGGADVNVSLSISGDAKKIISDTLGESGLDLSDIIDVEPVAEEDDDA